MAVSVYARETDIDVGLGGAAKSLFGMTGLRFHPFSSPGQTLSYCDVPVVRKSYEQLLKAFEQPQKLPIVIGPEGAGKTTLMRKISLFRSRRFVMLQGSAGLTVSNLIKRLAIATDLSLPSLMKTPIEQTQQILDNLQQKQVTLTVMVDRAHLLPLETLAALIHGLAQQADLDVRSLAIGLFGEESLVDRAKSLTLGGEEGIQLEVISLEPLEVGDIAHYCFTRLRHAGWQGMMPALSKNLTASVLERTGGLPGKINQVITEHYFSFWLESWQSGQKRQDNMQRAPQARSKTVRFLSVGMLMGMIGWLTLAPAWAMQYGSWNQACHTVFHGYVSFSDYLVHHIAHVLA